MKHAKPAVRRSERAFKQVLALVASGKLAPGERLPGERDLATTVGVSRPMLREALNALEAMGYIERRQKSGNYLCTAIPDSVRTPIDQGLDARLFPFADVLELRKTLETWAVVKAASAPSAQALGQLRACVQTMARTAALTDEQQLERYREADLGFHQVIARMAGNVVYLHLYDYFADLVRRSIGLSKRLVERGFGQANLAQHRAILAAIERRDTGAAMAAMESHFEWIQRAPRARR